MKYSLIRYEKYKDNKGNITPQKLQIKQKNAIICDAKSSRYCKKGRGIKGKTNK
jgi:hypothetical protein